MRNITFFQAANLSDSEVIGQFVVRKNELELILSDIRQDDMKGSIQHYILVGQRGSGKSTLLRRIQAEINTDNTLNNRLIAINLSEEQAGIYRLHDLWDKVSEELRLINLPVQEVDWEEFDNDLTAYAKASYHEIQKALSMSNKKIVLLLDNIDRIFDNIKTEDNHLFRELLMNHKDVRIIGGSTRLSEHHWNYDKPFYQFFRIIRLESLSQQEMKDLLLFWADFMQEPKLKTFANEYSGKLNAVRILSDGMPRTMLTLVDLLINKPEEHGYEYLKHIIDKATPIYQERLAVLSPLQQKIVLELSFYWDATKAKELSVTAKMDTKTLSAVLKQLVDLQIVEKRAGSNKNMLYLLKERFFNLWLIMTQGGPKQKSRVKWLTIFLEIWYEPNELKQAYQKFSTEFSEGKLNPGHAVIMTKAFVHSKILTIYERDNLLNTAKEFVGNNKEYNELLPPRAQDVFNRAITLIEENKYEEAVQELEQVEQYDEWKEIIKGFAWQKSGAVEKAEKQFLDIARKGNIDANFYLANLYDDINRWDDAEKFYQKAINKGHIASLFSLAVLYYYKNKNHDVVFKYLEQYKSLGNFTLKHQLFHIIAQVWRGRIEALDQSEDILFNAMQPKETNILTSYIAHLLIHYQTTTVWQYFQHAEHGNNLRDMLKPVYFATAHFLQNETGSAVLLTQPPELNDTVHMILTAIQDKRKLYYPNSK